LAGDAGHYRELVDDECLMVHPQPPFVMSGTQAIEAVAHAPRWSKIEISQEQMQITTCRQAQIPWQILRISGGNPATQSA
jgi:hypothetical protein